MNEQDEKKAEAIVKAWYWQVAEGHNYRWRHAAKTMTLFYESAPLEADALKLVVEYLRTRESVAEIVVNHKRVLLDGGWKASDAWYQTAVGEKWNGSDSTKVRLYWSIVQAGDGEADGPYAVENGCKYLVKHRCYWDVAEEPSLPESSSGVQYSIQGFSRNRETGLYSYVVEERTTLRQDVELYETAETLFETTSEEAHLGVKQQDVASAGLAAGVADGVAVTRQVTKNPDCTSDVRNVKVVKHKVEGARRSTSKTLRGTTTTTVDRNLTDAELAAKTSAPADSGETRIEERTPEKLNDLTVERFAPADSPTTIAESCDSAYASETDSTTTQVAVGDIGPLHPQAAEVNVRRTVAYRRNDDGKTADRTVTVETRTPQESCGETQSGEGADGEPVSTTTVERVQDATEAAEVESGDGGVNVVVEVDNQPNGMGGFHTVKRRTEHRPERALGETRSGAAAAADAAVVTTVERVHNAAEAAEVESGDGGVNVVVEVDNQPNGMGGFHTVKRKTEYRERVGGGAAQYGPAAAASGDVETGGVEVETTHKVNAAQESVAAGERGVNKVVEVDNQPNEHGSFTVTKRTTTYHPQRNVVEWEDDDFEYRRVFYANQPSPLAPAAGSADAAWVRDQYAQPNDHGSYGGGYLVRKRKTPNGGRLVVDEGKDVSYFKTRRYGNWQRTIVGTTEYLHWAWEFRRVCTMRFRVVGLSGPAADDLAAALAAAYTREVGESVFDDSPTATRDFVDVSGSVAKMTRVFKYHVEGDVYGVAVHVNEQSVKLRSAVKDGGTGLSPQAVFTAEGNWQYPTSAS